MALGHSSHQKAPHGGTKRRFHRKAITFQNTMMGAYGTLAFTSCGDVN
jgi:hypothetical protein